MADWNWRFFGFQWLNGNKPVQDWFNSLPDEAKDEGRDVIAYLRHLPSHLWKRPQFDPLGGEDVSEIRFSTAAQVCRFYGFNWPTGQRQVYTLLHGVTKKVSNDTKGKSEASKRRKYLENGQASVHGFEFNAANNLQAEERA